MLLYGLSSTKVFITAQNLLVVYTAVQIQKAASAYL